MWPTLSNKTAKHKALGFLTGNPRFQNETFAANLGMADRLCELAQEKKCTPAQLALAWILRRHRDVVPIPGTGSIARLDENAHAVDIKL